jgi:flagellar hook-basal body complex protein FliE
MMTDLRIGGLSENTFQNKASVKPKPKESFGNVINNAIQKVGNLENEADGSIVELVQGKADIHETMVALQKSDISMRMFLAVRNKAIEAYREIMRMQF